MPLVRFIPADRCIQVEAGVSLLDAAAQAGVHVMAPCGGEGTCGQCRVQVEAGSVECVPRGCLTAEEIAGGTVLACSSRITSDVTIRIPEEDAAKAVQIVTDAAGHRLAGPGGAVEPLAIRRFLKLAPPTADDSLSDWERLTRSLSRELSLASITPRLTVLQNLAASLRDGDFQVTVTLMPLQAEQAMAPKGGQDARPPRGAEMIRIEPGNTLDRQLGLAIDVGTTTCAVRLVDLATGRILGTAADYNGQLARGADIISRINYARVPQRGEELRRLVLDTLNTLIRRLCDERRADPEQIGNVVLAGNTTMVHLLLGLPPEYIRLAPYTPTVNRPPVLAAGEVGLAVHPEAAVLFAPGVGSYVGGDITAGLIQTAFATDSDDVRLFLDFGTNGEVVLGNNEWLMACAASAGPAFEGGGVSCGMRAMTGAIESVRIDPVTRRPAVSVIGGGKPRGICGSGLVDLLSELMSAGLIDPSGKLLHRPEAGGTSVAPAGESGRNLQYTVVTAEESATGKPITIHEHDIANLIRTKAAVYSACAVMLKSVGLDFDAVVEVYVAGGFGRYLNLERSISIGLLPDLPEDRFTYLGNSALTGAHAMLCDAAARRKAVELADRLTYLELNVDPAYMSEYTAALFLPHTDIERFPTVKRKREGGR